MQIRLQNFRAFGEEDWFELKPITVFLGENGAGKTSLLAGIRYALLLNSQNGAPSFNSPPFFLGSYKQIAHHPGAPKSISNSFTISMRDERFLRMFRSSDRGRTTVESEAVFQNVDSQPVIRSLCLSCKFGSMRVDDTYQDDSEVTVKIVHPASPPTEIKFLVDSAEVRAMFTQSSNLNYFPFFIRRAYLESVRKPGDESPPWQLELPEGFDDLFEALYEWSSISINVYAAGPVRSEPLRVYNPATTDSVSPEGSHAINALALLKKQKSKDWKRYKDIIERFGEASGSFKSFDIKRLGKDASDPFQVNVKTGNVTTNIIDTGYGVSQVIPILYELLSSQHNCVFMQQPEVHLHPRAQATLGKILCEIPRKGRTIIIESHSEYMVDSIRAAVRDQVISEKDVGIYFVDGSHSESAIVDLRLSSSGDFENATERFNDFFLKHTDMVIGAKKYERILG